MTTRTLRVRADISGALNALDRLQNRGRRVSRQLNNLSGGTAGRTIGGVRGGLAGGGRIALAGAGIGAGAAIFEKLFESLFELFEDTPILEGFTASLKELLKAVAPVAGVLIGTLTPIIKALAPVAESLAVALAPLIELLGAKLLLVITILAPPISKLAEGLGFLFRHIRDFVVAGLPPIIDFMEAAVRKVVDFLNKLPGIDIELPEAPIFELPEFRTDQLDASRQQVNTAIARREREEREREEAQSARAAPSSRRAAGGRADPRTRAIAERIAASNRLNLERRDAFGFAADASAPRRMGERIDRAAPAPPQAPRQNLSATIIVEVDGEALETSTQQVALRNREYAGR